MIRKSDPRGLVCPLKHTGLPRLVHAPAREADLAVGPGADRNRSQQKRKTELRVAENGMPRTKDKRYARWLRLCGSVWSCKTAMDRFLRRDDQGVRWADTPPRARGETELALPGSRGRMLARKPYLDHGDSPGSAYILETWIEDGRLAKYLLDLSRRLTEGQRQRTRMEKRNIRMFIRALVAKQKERCESEGMSVRELQEFMVRVATLNDNVWVVPLPTDVQKFL